MRQIIEVNAPALSKPCSIARGDVSVWNASYVDSNRVVQTASDKNVAYRLTKDYENNGLKFNLSMLIDSNNVGKAEKFLEKLAKSITSEKYQQYVNTHQAFMYLEERYKP